MLFSASKDIFFKIDNQYLFFKKNDIFRFPERKSALLLYRYRKKQPPVNHRGLLDISIVWFLQGSGKQNAVKTYIYIFKIRTIFSIDGFCK